MYLFVYGTLRFSDSLIKQGELKCEFEFVGRGKMKALLYDIGNYPGAVYDKSGHEVDGELYRFCNEEKVLRTLDRYEGFDQDNEKSCEYIRRQEPVLMDNGEYQVAWVYWYNRETGSKLRIEQNDYLEYLRVKSAKFEGD